MTSNPWQVESIQAFYCLKCPECDFDSKEENLFESHATANHPLSLALFDKEHIEIETYKDNIISELTDNVYELKKNEEEFKIDLVKEEPMSDFYNYPEVSVTKENSVLDISKIKEEITFADPLDIIVDTKSNPDRFVKPHSYGNLETNDLDKSHESSVDHLSNLSEESILPKEEVPLVIQNYPISMSVHLIRCAICNLGFPFKTDLKTHIESVHVANKQNKCSACDSSFSSKQSLIVHISSVHDGTPFITKIDESSKSHISSKYRNNKPFKCPNCESRYTEKRNLKSHIATVHEGKENKCSICDKSFSNSHILKSHIFSIHEKKKPFKCSDCETRFSQKRSLIVHIAKVHEGNKPFKCITCDAGFTANSSLKKHIATVHEKNKPFK
jgi:uncharacterized C2H2 Zn-finger protein